ncbi:MAG: hypothetical protein RR751_07010 [Clostridia bacterium]
MNNNFSKVVLGTIMVAGISVPFSNVLAAADAPALTIDGIVKNHQYVVGEYTEFDLVTKVTAGDARQNVKGVYVVDSGTDTDVVIEQKNDKGQWAALSNADKAFPSTAAFEVKDATLKLRAKFVQPATYKVTFHLKDDKGAAFSAPVTVSLDAVVNTVNVANATELRTALTTVGVKNINLTADISGEKSFEISQATDQVINGNGHIIETTGVDVNAITATNAVTIKDAKIKSNGGYGIAVAASKKATLAGNIDLSGNAKGGINLVSSSTLDTTAKDLKIVNATESYAAPTFKSLATVAKIYAGVTERVDGANYFGYLSVENSIQPISDQLNAEADADTAINLKSSKNDKISKAVLAKLKKGTARVVNITLTNGAKISFNTKDIVDTVDFALGLDFGKDINVSAALKKALANDNVMYINLAQDGSMQKGMVYTVTVGTQYTAGTELFVYSYDAKANTYKKSAKKVKVDLNKDVELKLENGQTYFLSEKEIVAVVPAEKPADVKNPNTADFSAFMMSALAIIGVSGLAFVNKKSKKQD